MNVSKNAARWDSGIVKALVKRAKDARKETKHRQFVTAFRCELYSGTEFKQTIDAIVLLDDNKVYVGEWSDFGESYDQSAREACKSIRKRLWKLCKTRPW